MEPIWRKWNQEIHIKKAVLVTLSELLNQTMSKTSITRTVIMLLLLLNRFSRVRLCATPETTAHQAPASLGFSRQEHWSGLPLPSPMHESEKWKWSRSVVSYSSRPHGLRSLPGSSVHGSFQARVLEWVASAFSTNDLITSISKLQGEKNLYLFANSEQIPCLDPFHSWFEQTNCQKKKGMWELWTH